MVPLSMFEEAGMRTRRLILQTAREEKGGLSMIYLLDFTYQGLPHRWVRMYEEGPNGAQAAIAELHRLGHEVTLSTVPDDTPWEEIGVSALSFPFPTP